MKPKKIEICFVDDDYTEPSVSFSGGGLEVFVEKDMYCVRIGPRVTRYPLMHIRYVEELNKY